MSRKHVLQKSLMEQVEPPAEGQHIVMAMGSRGSNIMEVRFHGDGAPATHSMRSRAPLQYGCAMHAAPHAPQSHPPPPPLTAPPPLPPQVGFPDGRRTLVLLPARFHKKLWIKRGNYLIVEESCEGGDAAVTGQIVHVLFADDVKQLKKVPGVWPSEFSGTAEADAAAAELGRLALASEAAAERSSASDEAAAAAAREKATSGDTTTAAAAEGEGEEGGYSSSDDDLPPIARPQNRKVIVYEISDSDSDSD